MQGNHSNNNGKMKEFWEQIEWVENVFAMFKL